MVKIKYIGKHQPNSMTIDVDEDRAKELIKSHEYEYADIKKSVIKPEVKKDDSKLSTI